MVVTQPVTLWLTTVDLFYKTDEQVSYREGNRRERSLTILEVWNTGDGLQVHLRSWGLKEQGLEG